VELGRGRRRLGSEALWRRHLEAGTEQLMAHVSDAVLDVME